MMVVDQRRGTGDRIASRHLTRFTVSLGSRHRESRALHRPKSAATRLWRRPNRFEGDVQTGRTCHRSFAHVGSPSCKRAGSRQIPAHAKNTAWLGKQSANGRLRFPGPPRWRHPCRQRPPPPLLRRRLQPCRAVRRPHRPWRRQAHPHPLTCLLPGNAPPGDHRNEIDNCCSPLACHASRSGADGCARHHADRTAHCTQRGACNGTRPGADISTKLMFAGCLAHRWICALCELLSREATGHCTNDPADQRSPRSGDRSCSCARQRTPRRANARTLGVRPWLVGDRVGVARVGFGCVVSPQG